MNGATSGVKAGTALSSKEERGHDAAGIARTSIVEDARLYPEVSLCEDMAPFGVLSKHPCPVVALARCAIPTVFPALCKKLENSTQRLRCCSRRLGSGWAR